MLIAFDVQHFYYLPQYLPLCRELRARGVTVELVVHPQGEWQRALETQLQAAGLDFHWVASSSAALEYYHQLKPDWVVFGNACPQADQLHAHSRTALMQHGIGPKACYYDVSESPIQVRFVEGRHRLERLSARFPDKVFVDTGYAKLDPLINQQVAGLDLASLGLDPARPTLLYAPTFYPSSIERLPRNWPELLGGYNLLIKPHFFSLTKSAYRKQRRQFERWQAYPNVAVAGVEQTNLLPFMASADLLLSDASSTLFEFVALGKPAIWCDFYQLRWSYRGPLSFRFKARMDEDLHWFAKVARQVKNPGQLVAAIPEVLNEGVPPGCADIIAELAGRVDGQCSARIADYLLTESDACV